MKYYQNGNRFSQYYKWNNIKYEPYNYERYGLLNHLMSSKIISSKNYMLNIMLSYVENSLIFVMRYIDKLKNFKNIHSSNR